ncbi:MAG: UPF0147 family protein [Euryarchaeota archaeon]|nr:UPF0147 family protein [Euryarchaeota archaeon]MDE1837910.1 UPF0147 family protein [Euryarchaeota archaeon]
MSATATPTPGAPRAASPATPAQRTALPTSPTTPPSPVVVASSPTNSPLDKILASLGQMAEDPSLPRNIRRGAQGARETLTKGGSAIDVRVAGAVGLLDDLANDSNIPVHGRTAIWSLISQLESIQ